MRNREKEQTSYLVNEQLSHLANEQMSKQANRASSGHEDECPASAIWSIWYVAGCSNGRCSATTSIRYEEWSASIVRFDERRASNGQYKESHVSKFGTTNFMWTSITANIAPPTNNVAPPPSGTTSIVKTACAAPPPPGTTIMNVDPHQSGWTHVVQMTATMNFVDLPSSTMLLVMTDNSMTHPDSDTLAVGKSNARRKWRRVNHKKMSLTIFLVV